jgi:phosphoserine phosphatase
MVAVLIARPGSSALGQEFIDAAAISLQRLSSTGAEAPPLLHDWLAPGEACEVHFLARRSTAAGDYARLLRALPGPQNYDLAVIPNGQRRKQLIIADMESTIIQQECLDELADYVGMRAQVAAITERAMRGELDFSAALKERVGLLKGLDAGVLEKIYKERVVLMPGAQVLIATMKAHGAMCALVSGGFTYFTERIAARLGFDAHQANQLDIISGRIAGTVGEPILGREAKLAALKRLAREGKLEPAQTMAVGDGANDLGMIKAAGLGVAFRAKPIVAAEAPVSIVFGDLTALLYLQGYRRHEFIV